MEHSFELERHERIDADALQFEHQRLLARYGAVTLELEALRVLLPQAKERQRDLINRILAGHKISNYLSARIDGDYVLCQLQESQNGVETVP